jgi:hypothetical protein
MFNAGREFDYEFTYQTEERDQESARKKDYRRGGSSFRPTRRRHRKQGPSHPGFGIAGRRNRRWSW